MVLQFTERGIYCPAGDFYIDPWRPVDRALITHGHADHARPGHAAYLCSSAAAPVIRHRLGRIKQETLPFGQTLRIGGAQVSFHPAGHLPGSAQIRVEVAGEVWVASGDYKLAEDGLCEAFEPVRCHSFITECTFGLPVFNWRPQQEVAQQINRWWASNRAAGKVSVLGAYSLGKAQRLLAMVDPSIGPILTHTAVEATNQILRTQNYVLPETICAAADQTDKTHPGALLIVPPAALDSNWVRRFRKRDTAFASGWMALRGVRRRRAMGHGFVISDHADWPDLLTAIHATGAENIYATHGYTEVFAKYLNTAGWNAQEVPTQFGDTEEETADPEAESVAQ